MVREMAATASKVGTDVYVCRRTTVMMALMRSKGQALGAQPGQFDYYRRCRRSERHDNDYATTLCVRHRYRSTCYDDASERPQPDARAGGWPA
jgi:hypothetical protein